MPFDRMCWELAKSYAADQEVKPAPDEVDALAQIIQDAIEEWVRYWEEEVEIRALETKAGEGVRDED